LPGLFAAGPIHLKKSPAMMLPAIFYLYGPNRLEKLSGLFQLLKLTMPGAFVAESLRSFLEFRNRTAFRTCAEAGLTAGDAELVSLEFVIRVLDIKILATTDRTFH
jgi:hypothetical protein